MLQETTFTDVNKMGARTVGRQTMSSFERFYRSDVLGLYRTVSLALGNTELGREAVDEAMARAFKHWKKIEGYENPSGWVYRVAVNWGRNRIRSKKKEAPESHAPSKGFDSSIDPDFHRALMSLSIDARSVVVLRHLYNYSTEEAAAVLGVAPGTVKSRLSRAIDELRPALTEMREAQ